MKFRLLHAALIGMFLTTALAHLSAQPAPMPAPAPLGPRLTFATTKYDFGKITGGTIVKYTYVLTNTGDQTLEITGVAPGCHCTTAGDWTHHVAPGQTGAIPIKFDSGNFSGGITRTIAVTSNDKVAPRQTLFLTGTIWQPFKVTPQFAYINVLPDALSNSTCIVHITSQSDEPVTLSDPTSATPSFKAQLKTVQPGKEFELIITAVPPFAPGNTVGRISVRTSLTNLAPLTITTMAAAQPTFTVMPADLLLPRNLLTWMTNSVTINNNRGQPLVLSDPQICCDPQTSVELKTITPGHTYQLIMAFPPGFDASTNAARATVKSNDPGRPLITVPIRTYFPPGFHAGAPHHPRPASPGIPPQLMPPVSARP